MSEGYIYPDPHPPPHSVTGRAFGLASASKMVTWAPDVPVFDEGHHKVGKTRGRAQVHRAEQNPPVNAFEPAQSAASCLCFSGDASPAFPCWA